MQILILQKYISVAVVGLSMYSTLSPQEVAAACHGLKHVPKLKKPFDLNKNKIVSPAACYRLDLIQTARLDTVLGQLGVLSDYTTTTNLRITQETFDMEARTAMTQIAGERIMGGNGEVYVQPKMIQLLVDTSNHEGAPIAIDRFGLAKTTSTTLTTQISFEQCGLFIGRAANRGEYDDLSQVSAATILGRIPEGLMGTAVCNVSVVPVAVNDAPSSSTALIMDEDASLNTTTNTEAFDTLAHDYLESLMI